MRRVALIIACTLLLSSPASADLRDVGRFLYGTTLKGLGGFSAFVLHEACHFGTTAAFGGKSKYKGGVIYASGISRKGHRATAISGGFCTGLLSELIMAKRWHKKSHVAWGALAFHTANVIGYGSVKYGDVEHWTGSGGKRSTWMATHYAHGSRSAYVLAKDFDWNMILNRPMKGEMR